MKLFILALALLSLASSAHSQTGCQFYIGSTLFNFCSGANTNVNATIPYEGTVSISLGPAQVSSCDNTHQVWGILITDAGECSDILTVSPTYTYVDEQLNITFPVQSQSNGMSYQVNISLSCYHQQEMFLYDLSMAESMTTYTFTGSSPFACGQPSSCTSTTLGDSTYDLCKFGSSVFTVPASFGGQFSFTFGQDPVLSCQGSPTWATYTDAHGYCYGFSSSNPSALSNPEQGLNISFEGGQGQYGYYSQNLVLLCDPDQESSEIAASFSGYTIERIEGAPYIAFSLTGSSPYACPLGSDEIKA